jgi:hemerythrin-like metal-binding protein
MPVPIHAMRRAADPGGAPTFDVDVRAIRALGARVLELAASGPRETFEPWLEVLGLRVAEQFAREERLMRLAGHPGHAAHRAEHEALLARWRTLRAEAGADRTALAGEVAAWLRRWTDAHVAAADAAFDAWARENAGRTVDPARVAIAG